VLAHFRSTGARIIVLSEYGITAVDRPVHINRVLREAGLLSVRLELGREVLDPGASVAFAVADHQIAHVYVSDPSRIESVRSTLRRADGIEAVLGADQQRGMRLNHARSGELIAMSAPNAFFTYYYWLDDARAPDFARTVDIHRKPGYDPAELFLDPAIRFPKLTMGWKLWQRRLGFRNLINVTPLDAKLVRGSHGLPPAAEADGPVLLTSHPDLLKSDHFDAPEVFHIILEHVFRDD
jgi:predicted AlkP superfamily pyrophosphatase or phosphodiesterase